MLHQNLTLILTYPAEQRNREILLFIFVKFLPLPSQYKWVNVIATSDKKHCQQHGFLVSFKEHLKPRFSWKADMLDWLKNEVTADGSRDKSL